MQKASVSRRWDSNVARWWFSPQLTPYPAVDDSSALCAVQTEKMLRCDERTSARKPLGRIGKDLGIALCAGLIFRAIEERAPQYFLGGPDFLDRDNFNTHRGLAITATDVLGKIDLVDCSAFFARQFSN
jgi:hypothetical protein